MSQPKLVIKESGWAGFTGPLFGIEFVNGESVTQYTQMQMRQVSAMISVQTVDGHNPSVTQQMVDTQNTPMDRDMVRNEQTGELTTGAAMAEAIKPRRIWTVEELNAVADDKGISGIREIADPLNVHGREIAALIVAIMKSQA